ncbi:MAG: 4-hydroxy-tetrahydrodipicolinate synthase [Myxococcales bacterium]|nr:4-hydroxy-tetrahydrodipicolinate synthase [Myxococcales bacterium]MDH3483865.1 4-hydroxy-tetrahydrodipicolinate synthase [Myxococcales bacterium]
MSGTFRPHGVWTALVTPFSTDQQVDHEALRRLIEFQLSEGVDGVVPCGTTGESPTLSWQEHDAVIDAAVRVVEARAGVLAGTGSNNTKEAIRGTAHAKDVGATAALLVDCYYNGPSSLELRAEYYERILDEVADIPIVPYIIPGRTGCELSSADLAVLHLNHPRRVPAVKQATGDVDRMRLDRKLAGPALGILSGDDDMTLTMMRDPEIRASGVISVMSNLVPGTLSSMVRAQEANDLEETDRLAAALSPILALVTCQVTSVRPLPNGQSVEVTDKFRNPVPLKTMMAGLGMITSASRAPLGRMSAAAVAQCRDALRNVHSGDPAILGPIEEPFDVRIGQRLGDDAIWSALAR